ncbi:MAG TPA: pyridoxine 5'-phosphate synthase [bacterium (Candidatus Stahlbacteria)]|nr:pyridoxine 5'-phosphate synthase [Candidatus Stahlbacteria bacterium]
MNNNMRLGVNVDHVATLREARGTNFPDPVEAAVIVEFAGAHNITVHLRQDRRHIKERDVRLIKELIKIPLNLEASLAPDIQEFTLEVVPHSCCLVPERVQEITTEGGLDIIKTENVVESAVKKLKEKGIGVTVFIEPDEAPIRKAASLGVNAIEINTGKYAEQETQAHIDRIKRAASLALSLGLEVHAGHGLNYRNVKPIAKIKEITELSIGHSIVARALFVGFERAVREMLELINE